MRMNEMRRPSIWFETCTWLLEYLLYIPSSRENVDMSADEIIVELTKLDRLGLEKVDERLHQLLHEGHHSTSSGSWGEALLAVAGTAEGLPKDLAHNHDHYLYGTPKK